jgi:Zn-dependent protease with chaperone function
MPTAPTGCRARESGDGVFDRLTDQARTAILLSRGAADHLGHDTVDSCHLLLGLLATEHAAARPILVGLGVTDPALRAYAARHRPSGTARPDEHIPFTAELQEVLEAAQREAVGLGHINLTTGHLLLGVAGHPDAVGMQAIGALGTDPATLGRAVLDRHDRASTRERPLTSDDAVAALADVRLDPGLDLPGRRSVAWAVIARLVWYAAMAAALLAAGWDTVGPELIGTLMVALPLIVGGLTATVGHALQVNRMVAGTEPAPPMLPELTPVLAARGLRSLQVRVQTDGPVRDRAYRARRQGWIVLSRMTVGNPRRLRFVLSHELAHLIRNDPLCRRLDGALYNGVVVTSLVSLDPVLWAIGAIGVLGQQVLTSWRAELACDTIAMRWVGAEALRIWAEHTRIAMRLPPNRTVGRRVRRLVGLLTHPPITLRLVRARR